MVSVGRCIKSMGASTKVNSKMRSRMAMDDKFGTMASIMLVNIRMISVMVSVNLCTRVEPFKPADGKMTNLSKNE